MDLNSTDLLKQYLHWFYTCLHCDPRLRSAHVSLYHSLLLMQYLQNGVEEFVITRKELMRFSRIGSIATYQKCIYELVKFGYIEYKPTFNSYIGTKVRLIFLTGGRSAHHHDLC